MTEIGRVLEEWMTREGIGEEMWIEWLENVNKVVERVVGTKKMGKGGDKAGVSKEAREWIVKRQEVWREWMHSTGEQKITLWEEYKLARRKVKRIIKRDEKGRW